MLGHMDDSRAYQQQVGTMRSTVAWALLGLVIERPSYGYELLQRFRRTYGDMVAFSSSKQLYTALDALKTRSLIEQMEGVEPDEAPHRQPRPRYRATPQGVAAYQDWLFIQIEEERQRSRLFARQLAMLEPHAALEVIDEYERECLAGADDVSPAETERESMAERLANEEEQMSLEVRLTWIEYARNELKALLGELSEEGKDA